MGLCDPTVLLQRAQRGGWVMPPAQEKAGCILRAQV